MTLRVFMIVGEASGDTLGADIIKSAKQSGTDIKFHGVAGPKMIRAGMKTLFPMTDIAVMGITEILPKLPLIFGRLDEAVKSIEAIQPDIVLSIDCPDFSLRVQKRLKKRGKSGAKRIHYVAPTVWAWRPGRAKSIARFLDRILCLFPFEPPYFEKEGLKADYVGHPIAAEQIKVHTMKTDRRLIGLYPGSRKSEINMNADVIFDTARLLLSEMENCHFIVPSFEAFESQILQKAEKYSLSDHVTVVTDDPGKRNIMSVLEAAVAVNGTVGLELALAGVPHLICYKTSAFSYWLAKRLVKIEHIHLVNILADHDCLNKGAEPIVPEYIQNDAKSGDMAAALEVLLDDAQSRDEQINNFAAVREVLQPPGLSGTPSEAVLVSMFKTLNSEKP